MSCQLFLVTHLISIIHSKRPVCHNAVFHTLIFLKCLAMFYFFVVEWRQDDLSWWFESVSFSLIESLYTNSVGVVQSHKACLHKVSIRVSPNHSRWILGSFSRFLGLQNSLITTKEASFTQSAGWLFPRFSSLKVQSCDVWPRICCISHCQACSMVARLSWKSIERNFSSRFLLVYMRCSCRYYY